MITINQGNSQNKKNFAGNILIFAIAVILAPTIIPAYAFPYVPESLEDRRLLAQNEWEELPMLLGAAPSTQELIHALEHAELKHQRRYAAELLGDCGDKEALPHLLKALDDPEEVVQKAVAEALEDLGDNSIFEQLTENLSDPNACVRKYSAYVLGRLAKKEDTGVVEALESVADDEDRNVRVEVVYALKEIGSPTSKSIFFQGLDDEEPRIRRHSAIALGNLKDSEAGWALVLALQRETDKDVRRTITSALGKVGTAGAARALIEALPNEPSPVRADIADALSEIKTPDAIRALIELLSSDASAKVRERAAIGLRDAKARSAVNALAGALKDRSPIVRRPASEALVSIADASVMDELVGALGDTDFTVADNAAQALIRLNNLEVVHGLIRAVGSPNRLHAQRAMGVLEAITHRPYGSNAGKWKQWYEENFKTSK